MELGEGKAKKGNGKPVCGSIAAYVEG